MDDKLHRFENDAIAVTWSRRRCIHAAECVFGLPTVFEPGRRPWIDPDGASADAVADVVRRCPTGALHYERKDGGEDERRSETNTVRVSRQGPILMRGEIQVLDEAGAVWLEDTRVALCRCGGSKGKPLCDNAHIAAAFRDEGALAPEAVLDAGGTAAGPLRVTPMPDGPLKLEGPFALGSADGRTFVTGTLAKLCRCGQSSRKPFCDGTHRTVGFTTG